MSTAYHHSVRHYTSPFPLGHRNARPLPSPDSNLGPWGAVHHTEKTATSPHSASHDKRNRSSVPLSSGASRKSSPSRKSGGGERQVGPQLSGDGVQFSPGRNHSGSDAFVAAPNQQSHGEYFCAAAEQQKHNPQLYVDPHNDSAAPHDSRRWFSNGGGAEEEDGSSNGDASAEYAHLTGGALLPYGKGPGEFSEVAAEQRVRSVVPQAWDVPHTLRLAQQRGRGADAGIAGSPRRRGPARVPCGFIYKNTGLDAATHVQVPMGYRPVSNRPQIAAKVTQYSPWKPMDQQAPLPTLEPRVASPPRPYASGDASLKYAPTSDAVSPASSSLRGGRNAPYPAVTLADYHLHDQPALSARREGARPTPLGAASVSSPRAFEELSMDAALSPSSSPTSPFETSRRVYPGRDSRSNVPMSPNRRRDSSKSSLVGTPTRTPQQAASGIVRSSGPQQHDASHHSSYQATIPSPHCAMHQRTPTVVNSSGATQSRSIAVNDDQRARRIQESSPREHQQWSYDHPDDDNESIEEWQEDGQAKIARGRKRNVDYGPQEPVVPPGWAPTSFGLAQQKVAGSPRRRGPARVPCGFIYKNTGLDAATHVQVPMGYRPVSNRPQIAAKVTQYSPWKPMDQQAPLPTLEQPSAVLVERLAATPLIIEVDERLAAQGLGSLLDIRYSSDDRVSNVLKHLGFGPADRMTILWELRRKHPVPAGSMGGARGS